MPKSYKHRQINKLITFALVSYTSCYHFGFLNTNKMEEEIEKNREIGNEKLLYDFLLFLKEKEIIDDFTFEYEKEISCFLYQDVLEKHTNLVYSNILKVLDFDNEKTCEVLNVILGKAE